MFSSARRVLTSPWRHSQGRTEPACRVASDAADCELLSRTHNKTHNTGCSRRKSPTAKLAAELDLHSVGTAGFGPNAASASRAASAKTPSRQGPRRWAGAESGRRDLNPRPPEPHATR